MDKSVKWNDIKKAYITENLSFRKLGERFGVSHSTIRDRAKRENWKQDRDELLTKTEQDIKDASMDELKTQHERLLHICDLIIDKLTDNLSSDHVDMLDIQRATKIYCDLHDRDLKENHIADEYDDDGFLQALDIAAKDLFNDGDDSWMIEQYDEDDIWMIEQDEG